MKQLGDEMKLPETCTFSLKFQTVETQESLITHGIRANESFAFSSRILRIFLPLQGKKEIRKRKKSTFIVIL